MLLIVKLDNPRFPGNGGTVIAHAASVADYLAQITDRDGAHDKTMRLWEGSAVAIGTKVHLTEA